MHPSEAVGGQPLTILRPARRYQLPAAPSLLLGRDADLDNARDLILGGHTRLLTLVGPPGVGKTRLALGIAEALQDEFEQGAAFVDLSSVRDAHLVLEAVAHTFGLRQQGASKPADQLDAYLRDASLLLVLDNFEHVLDASAEVGRLLALAPGLVVMATSRTALQLRWERISPVAPLPSEVAQAVFVERAQACRPDFVYTEANAAAIDEICTRLDGLPLAIELAAARCVVLSPQEIAARLRPRLDLLTDGPRDANARHQTLRRAIDWSHDLLTDSERTLLRRLSVFAGGFTLDAAEAMLEAPESGLELLSSLVRKNLVRSDTGALESRFRLLETVREYAFERLSAEHDLADAQRRHAEYFLRLVETQYPRNFGPEASALGDQFQREHPNLRQALGWALETGHVEMALRMGGGLHWFWYARGYLAEGSQVLESALAGADGTSLEARAVALRSAGALALNQGKLAYAIGLLESAAEIGRQRPADPTAHAELAMALGIQGVAQIAAGQYAAAEGSVRQSLAAFEALDDEWGIATAREVLGAIAALRGQAEEAEALASESLVVHRRLGSLENIARTLDVLGYAAALRNELPKARACFEESLALRRTLVNRPATATVLGRLGLVAYFGREWARAATYYRESLALAQEVGDDAGVVRCLGQVAALGVGCGADRGRVARLGSAVQHHRAALGLPSPPVERIAAQRLAAAMRAELSPVSLAAAWVTGRVLSLVQAAELGRTLLDSIAALLDEAGTQTSGPQRLTRREAEVAALIAQGRTNRQIAEELVIALRTADTHVERILGKLGFTSRAQVAAWITAHNSQPPTVGHGLGILHK